MVVINLLAKGLQVCFNASSTTVKFVSISELITITDFSRSNLHALLHLNDHTRLG